MTHPFDSAVALEQGGEHTATGATHPAYANMVGPFGGITAAVMLRAVEVQPDRIGEPVSLTVNFTAPIADGGYEILTRCVRTNRTNQHWIVELTQDDEVKTTATAVFGIRRDTWSDAQAEMPAVPGPHSVAPAEGSGFVKWIDNYDMRFVVGSLPGIGAEPSPSSVSTLWVRDRPPRPLDFASLAAICDVFYPRVFLRLARPVPAGTISMTTYFHVTGDDLAAHGDDYVLATTEARRFTRGYFDQTSQLFSPTGALMASSHQIVYYKA